MGFFTLFLITLIPVHFGLYKFFQKAGQEGWKAWIPVYNYLVFLKLTGKPWYWVISLPAPGLNLITFFGMVVAFFKSQGLNDSKSLWKLCLTYPYAIPKWAMDASKAYVPVDQLPSKRTKAQEWTESILFAVVAASMIKVYVAEPYRIPSSSMEDELLTGDFLVVSKFHYGAKVPQTPLSFPFVHNTLPFLGTTPSFLEWWKVPQMRLPGFSKVERNDIIVFNFPVNDTMIVDEEMKAFSYYNFVYDNADEWLMQQGVPPAATTKQQWETALSVTRKAFTQQFELRALPVDKRENFVKRCVAGPGDVFEMRKGQVYINGAPGENPEMISHFYRVYPSTNLNTKTKEALKEFYFSLEDQRLAGNGILNLNQKQVKVLRTTPGVDSVVMYVDQPVHDRSLWPNHPGFNNSIDEFQPYTIPAEGMTVSLSLDSLPFYERIIRAYEGRSLEVKNGIVYIDGAAANTYTFTQNYYWAMGDNRCNSLDSRYWGPVPQDHIVGTPFLVVLSFDGDVQGNFIKQLRTDRFFYLPE